MDQRQERALQILRELGGNPSAPFFEEGPARYIVDVLQAMGVTSRRDAYGNLIAHYRHRPAPDQPPIAFVAHMDHPGFEVIEAQGERLVARALGGVPVASLVQPTPVLVLTPDGGRLPGHTEPFHAPGADPQTPTGAESDRLVTLRLQSNEAVAPPAPVVFDLPDFVLEGETVRMRALDDLAGCAAILAALERLVADDAQAEVYGVFTRAEEVGLLGARLLAEAGTLPHETLVVSVEASAVIPGVAQGEGPVIRTGDASYTFDSDAEQVLAVARERLRERDRGFKCQRALMSGGTCEATAFAVFGYGATGVAFPLGNYHNATTRISDPEGGVDAEYIRLQDYLGGIDLISEAAVSVARRGDSPTRRSMRKVPEEARRRLADTAGA